jgi:hypothetical protein
MIHGIELRLYPLVREYACISERFGVIEALLGVSVPSLDLLFVGRD